MVARLRDAIQRGTTAAKPAATAVDVGTLYFDTDLDGLYRSNGTSWDSVERADVASGGLSAGTSFPGSPATNDRYFRTDRGLVYYYDGTRWVTETLYHLPLSGSDRGISTITANQAHYSSATMWEDLYDAYLVDYCWQVNIATTNNASNYWSWELQKLEATATTGTVIVTPTSAALSTGWSSGRTAINAVHTDIGSLRNNVNKTGTPGAFAGMFAVTYRLVG